MNWAGRTPKKLCPACRRKYSIGGKMRELKPNWWKNAVIYQIYPRSFQDSNGDGIGDLQGIISRLDYLQYLGIDAIWLSPVCKSPQADNGYDISDYRDIDPMFGSLRDMEQLISVAAEHGIGIILDLVLNHTSDEHPWFIEAKKSTQSPFHDYYVWRNGIEGTPPNEMKACFGGSAWEWVPEVGQYYFHQFAVKQPDLNWDNPVVRKEIFSMVRYWVDKGVSGFRLDVIDQIAKVPDQMITNNGPMLHSYLRELSAAALRGTNLVTVGEAWGATPEIARKFSAPDGSELSMVFQFEHICLDQRSGGEKWDLQPLPFCTLKKVLAKWQKELHGTGWNSLFWNNHDLPRIISRWGDDSDEYRELSAKMLATVLYGMQGTPYIYQGEELGMTNANLSISECRDIETLNMYAERKNNGIPESEIMASLHAKGRDNARTPMQWSADLNAGFTTGTPWLKVNPNHTFINAKVQISDSHSVFNYYKRLIAMRKEHSVFIDGDFCLLLPDDEDIWAYTRKLNGASALVLANFHSKEREVPTELDWTGWDLIISNYMDAQISRTLRAYEARIFLLR